MNDNENKPAAFFVQLEAFDLSSAWNFIGKIWSREAGLKTVSIFSRYKIEGSKAFCRKNLQDLHDLDLITS